MAATLATLECERLDRRRFKIRVEAQIAVFEFVEGLYYSRRRHSLIGISPRSTTSIGMRPIPAQASLPPCSPPSTTSPPGGPQTGLSLAATARDGRRIVPAGIRQWLRQGPNKRMA